MDLKTIQERQEGPFGAGNRTTLRDVDDHETGVGNSPGMLKATALGICKFFEAVPFVSRAGVFEDLKPHEGECNCMNIAVFLHNPPVVVRKPTGYWNPMAEWTFLGDYDYDEIFGPEFLEKFGEYHGSLPIMYAQDLTVVVFDELVVTSPAYRKAASRLWKRQTSFKRIFRTLKFHNRDGKLSPDPRWQAAFFDNRPYYWVLKDKVLVPSLVKPKFWGSVAGLHDYHRGPHWGDPRYATTPSEGRCDSVIQCHPWDWVGLRDEQSAKKQSFEPCEKCFPKRDEGDKKS